MLQVCIITGGNAGVGQATAEAMVARGARVIIACRDEGRARTAAEVTKHLQHNKYTLLIAHQTQCTWSAVHDQP